MVGIYDEFPSGMSGGYQWWMIFQINWNGGAQSTKTRPARNTSEQVHPSVGRYHRDNCLAT